MKNPFCLLFSDSLVPIESQGGKPRTNKTFLVYQERERASMALLFSSSSRASFSALSSSSPLSFSSSFSSGSSTLATTNGAPSKILSSFYSPSSNHSPIITCICYTKYENYIAAWICFHSVCRGTKPRF